jgi:BirA family biotin operon repressor/biotin-[acetyl-CoA-carboxylase] ligase
LSYILKPTPIGAKHIFMAGGVAVAELLEGLAIPNISIKWANDVRIAGKKVAGVLPEAVWEGDKLQGVVLGIGVNIRVNFADTELEHLATSIETMLNQPANRTDLITKLLARLDFWSSRLGSDELFQAWRSRLDTLGNTVTADNVTGTAIDVTHDGALVIQKSDGATHTVIAGDIS